LYIGHWITAAAFERACLEHGFWVETIIRNNDKRYTPNITLSLSFSIGFSAKVNIQLCTPFKISHATTCRTPFSLGYWLYVNQGITFNAANLAVHVIALNMFLDISSFRSSCCTVRGHPFIVGNSIRFIIVPKDRDIRIRVTQVG
jgi:hypothetical protein